jgi:hypothetical protein
MGDQVQPVSSDDIFVWPDGTMCYRHELEQRSHMSDDYKCIPQGSAVWTVLIEADEI